MCRIIVLNYVSIDAKSAENAQVLGGKKQNPADPSEHTGRDICWVCNSKIRGRTALLGETGGCACMQQQWYMARKIHM